MRCRVAPRARLFVAIHPTFAILERVDLTRFWSVRIVPSRFSRSPLSLTLPREIFDLSFQESQPQWCKLCMCTACTCGKHTKLCHPRRDSSCPPSPSTTTRIPRPRDVSPPDPRHARLTDTTTYTHFYSAKPFSGNPRTVGTGKTLDACLPSGTYTDANTDYSANFRDFHARPRNPITFPPPHRDQPSFSGSTTQASDYRWWPIHKRAPNRLLTDPTGFDPPGTFSGLTTYSTSFWDVTNKPTRRLEFYNEKDYGPGFVPRRLPEKPTPDNIASALGKLGGRFNARTTYMDKFRDPGVESPLRGRQLKNALAEPLDRRFEHDSTYNTDFKSPPRVRPCPAVMKPRPDIVTDNHLCF
ncbi:hypothetical protein SELMODRAFT_415621 [Selaginella moellendorffii]|uniref:Uncharacterized protein n=1 Tax=Selaginella moellendorffii TaxID=88036 RepID=D8RWQ4_SELML|nr:hypothetical protein SELMODRAFT_415621 [Selaginella moellendorffii]